MVEVKAKQETGMKHAGNLQAAFFIVVLCLAYPSTLKMRQGCSTEMSVDFHWNTWFYLRSHNPTCHFCL
jgi:hypothetical protein